MSSNKAYMTIPEFGRMIGVSADTARGIVERGEVGHTLIGTRKRVKRSEAKAYLQQHSYGGQTILHDAGAEAEALLR